MKTKTTLLIFVAVIFLVRQISGQTSACIPQTTSSGTYPYLNQLCGLGYVKLSNVTLNGSFQMTPFEVNKYHNVYSWQTPQLIPGQSYPIEVQLISDQVTSESVAIYIDSNDDGIFNEGSIFSASGYSSYSSSSWWYNAVVVLKGSFMFSGPCTIAAGQKLRMRVIVTPGPYQSYQPCVIPYNGQVWDFRVQPTGPKIIASSSSICEGEGVTLFSSAAANNYLWSTGESTPAIAVMPASSGNFTYKLQTSFYGGCYSPILNGSLLWGYKLINATDSINLTVNSKPIANAGADQSVCSGNNITLGGSPTGSGPGSLLTYAWSPVTGLNSSAMANPAASPASTTTYTVTVKSGACSASDAVTVTVNTPPVVNLGNDTTLIEGDILTLDANNTGSSYLWSNGAIIQTINVSVAGTYSVMVTNSQGCTGSDVINIAVLPYCNSKGNNSSYEWIKNVMLGSINNTSNNNAGYGNYSQLSTTLTQGTSYTIKLTPGFLSKSHTEYWRVWIDYNHDGDFQDVNELVISKNSKSSTSSSFVVPSGGFTGKTRMRVSMKRGLFSIPCELFAYGEVEDYTINIASNSSASASAKMGEEGNTITEAEQNTMTIYPNPASDVVNVSFFSYEDGVMVIQMMDMMGRAVSGQQLAVGKGMNRLNVDISILSKGIYFLNVQQGSENISTGKFVKN